MKRTMTIWNKMIEISFNFRKWLGLETYYRKLSYIHNEKPLQISVENYSSNTDWDVTQSLHCSKFVSYIKICNEQAG